MRKNEWSKQRFFAANSAKMNTLLKQRKQMRMAKAAQEKQNTLSAMEALSNAFNTQTPNSEATGQDTSESIT